MTLTDEEYRRAIDLCERAVTAARSDDGGPTVAGSFLGELATLLAEPVDEKSRGEAYLRGHHDGRLAERAGVPDVWQTWRADLVSPSWQPGDRPPFYPELADSPLVTGESGAPAPLVVDQPVHESTLPAELDLSSPRTVTVKCSGCGQWLTSDESEADGSVACPTCRRRTRP